MRFDHNGLKESRHAGGVPGFGSDMVGVRSRANLSDITDCD
jgi:hypothetical protein